MIYLGSNSDTVASGSITAQNSTPNGAATAGSAVEITLNGGALAIQVAGTYTGGLSLQATIDGSTWVTLSGNPFLNISTGGYLAIITSALTGIFQADVAAFTKARITALAPVTGAATISLRCSDATSMLALDAPLPTGANTIGSVNLTAGQTIATTMVDATATGTISATDTLAPAPAGNGVLVTVAPSANSFVALAVVGGSSQCDIQILGTATGTYYFEDSMDSTNGSDGNWIAVNYRQTGITNTQLGYSTAANGVYRGNPAGFKYTRVRNVGGSTPNNAITIRLTNGSGTVFQNASTPSGLNTMGKVGIDQSSLGVTNAVQAIAGITGGWTPFHLVSAATTNATVIKASAGKIGGYYIYNSNAAARKVAFHNTAGAPTAGASVLYSIIIPPNSGANAFTEVGIDFTTGIAITTTTGLADSDAVAVALNDLIINIFFK